MANPDTKGTRLQGALDKGGQAKAKGKARASNPYSRPNMRAKWFEGFDGAQIEKTSK